MPHEFAHRADLNGRWSMLAYIPGRDTLDLEYNFASGTAERARSVAAFEAKYAKRTHVKLRSPHPEAQVVYDGPVSGIAARAQGWQ